MINFCNTSLRLNFLFLSLFGIFILSGCSGTSTGSISNATATTSTTSPSTTVNSGNFCSPTRAQKIKTITASGISKYEAYISVGSSQVAAQ